MSLFDVPDYFLDGAGSLEDLDDYDEVEDEEGSEESKKEVKDKVKHYIG